MQHLNRSDLINSLTSEFCALPCNTITAVIKKLIAEITLALANGDKVVIRGFGSFKSKLREEYTARNPKTGEKIIVPQQSRVRFKMSKNLLAQLN